MDDKQRQQLIERVAQEVMAKLRKPVADIRPPIGVCTGDYSKFPELAGQGVGAANPAAGGTSEGATGGGTGKANNEPVLSGIVTATRLQDAISASSAGGGAGVVTIGPDARLTPLANDFVREHPEKIRRGTGQTTTNSSQSSRGNAGGWLWWIDGRCPVVQSAVQQRRDQVRVMTSTSLTDVVRELATGLGNHSLAGGVLFVRSSSKAICYANRCDAVRAIVGTNRDTVDEGVRDLAANVLVIEYPHVGPKVMNAMLDRMMHGGGAGKVSPIVARDLSELKRL